MAGARWVRLDVDYFRNSKAMTAGRDGRALHLASICWSGGQLSDGHVPEASVRALLGDAGVKAPAVERLLVAGLWVPNGDGYIVHDFLEMNPELTRAHVEKERARWREKQQEYRASKRNGQHGMSP